MSDSIGLRRSFWVVFLNAHNYVIIDQCYDWIRYKTFQITIIFIWKFHWQDSLGRISPTFWRKKNEIVHDFGLYCVVLPLSTRSIESRRSQRFIFISYLVSNTSRRIGMRLTSINGLSPVDLNCFPFTFYYSLEEYFHARARIFWIVREHNSSDIVNTQIQWKANSCLGIKC